MDAGLMKKRKQTSRAGAGRDGRRVATIAGSDTKGVSAAKAAGLSGAVRMSEVQLRLLVQNIGDVLWFKEIDPPRVTYVSPAFEQVWGVPAAELYADAGCWERSIHREDAEAVQAAWDGWLQGKSPEYRAEYRVISQTGEVRWLADRGIIISSQDGQPYQIGGIARDVTESKSAEMTRSRLAAVVDSSDDAILTMDLEGAIQTWNAGAVSIFGYEAEEMVGRSIRVLWPTGAEEAEAAYLENILRGERIRHYEAKRRHQDGRLLDISLTISPLLDGVGRITGFSKIARDITEQKRAERRFQDLLEAAPDALVIADREGCIRWVNAQAERLFGYERGELVGGPVGRLVSSGERRRYARHREQCCEEPHETRAHRGLEFRARRRDGSTFPMEVNLSQLESGEGTLVISDICDITERKRVEQMIRQMNAELERRVEQRTLELEVANAGLRGMIATRKKLEQEILRISEREQQRIGQDLHDDLGQQLAGAWMMSNVLERDLADRRAPEVAAAGRISQLLENALAKTRSLARGLHPVAAEQGGLGRALGELTERMAGLFQIRCDFHCPRPVAAGVGAEATHLYRITQEAVSNAVKHGQARHIQVHLGTVRGRLVLRVCDDGKGIGRTPPGGGQGMGLRIMQYRADVMNAELKIENQPKGGTCVKCTLAAPTEATPKEIHHGQKKTNTPTRRPSRQNHPRGG